MWCQNRLDGVSGLTSRTTNNNSKKNNVVGEASKFNSRSKTIPIPVRKPIQANKVTADFSSFETIRNDALSQMSTAIEEEFTQSHYEQPTLKPTQYDHVFENHYRTHSQSIHSPAITIPERRIGPIPTKRKKRKRNINNQVSIDPQPIAKGIGTFIDPIELLSPDSPTTATTTTDCDKTIRTAVPILTVDNPLDTRPEATSVPKKPVFRPRKMSKVSNAKKNPLIDMTQVSTKETECNQPNSTSETSGKTHPTIKRTTKPKTRQAHTGVDPQPSFQKNKTPKKKKSIEPNQRISSISKPNKKKSKVDASNPNPTKLQEYSKRRIMAEQTADAGPKDDPRERSHETSKESVLRKSKKKRKKETSDTRANSCNHNGNGKIKSQEEAKKFKPRVDLLTLKKPLDHAALDIAATASSFDAVAFHPDNELKANEVNIDKLKGFSPPNDNITKTQFQLDLKDTSLGIGFSNGLEQSFTSKVAHSFKPAKNKTRRKESVPISPTMSAAQSANPLRPALIVNHGKKRKLDEATVAVDTISKGTKAFNRDWNSYIGEPNNFIRERDCGIRSHRPSCRRVGHAQDNDVQDRRWLTCNSEVQSRGPSHSIVQHSSVLLNESIDWNEGKRRNIPIENSDHNKRFPGGRSRKYIRPSFDHTHPSRIPRTPQNNLGRSCSSRGAPRQRKPNPPYTSSQQTMDSRRSGPLQSDMQNQGIPATFPNRYGHVPSTSRHALDEEHKFTTIDFPNCERPFRLPPHAGRTSLTPRQSFWRDFEEHNGPRPFRGCRGSFQDQCETDQPWMPPKKVRRTHWDRRDRGCGLNAKSSSSHQSNLMEQRWSKSMPERSFDVVSSNLRDPRVASKNESRTENHIPMTTEYMMKNNHHDNLARRYHRTGGDPENASNIATKEDTIHAFVSTGISPTTVKREFMSCSTDHPPWQDLPLANDNHLPNNQALDQSQSRHDKFSAESLVVDPTNNSFLQVMIKESQMDPNVVKEDLGESHETKKRFFSVFKQCIQQSGLARTQSLPDIRQLIPLNMGCQRNQRQKLHHGSQLSSKMSPCESGNVQEYISNVDISDCPFSGSGTCLVSEPKPDINGSSCYAPSIISENNHGCGFKAKTYQQPHHIQIGDTCADETQWATECGNKYRSSVYRHSKTNGSDGSGKKGAGFGDTCADETQWATECGNIYALYPHSKTKASDHSGRKVAVGFGGTALTDMLEKARSTTLLNGTILDTANVLPKQPVQHSSFKLNWAEPAKPETYCVGGAYGVTPSDGPQKANGTTLLNVSVSHTTNDLVKEPDQLNSFELGLADATQSNTREIGGSYAEAHSDVPTKECSSTFLCRTTHEDGSKKESTTSLHSSTIPNTIKEPAKEPGHQLSLELAFPDAARSGTSGMDGHNNAPSKASSTAFLNDTIPDTTNDHANVPFEFASAGANQTETSMIGITFCEPHNDEVNKACSAALHDGTICNRTDDIAKEPDHHTLFRRDMPIATQPETSGIVATHDEAKKDGSSKATSCAFLDGTTHVPVKEPDNQVSLEPRSENATQSGTSGIDATYGEAPSDGPKKASSTTILTGTVPKRTGDCAKEPDQQISSFECASADSAQYEAVWIDGTSGDSYNDGTVRASNITHQDSTVYTSNDIIERPLEQISLALGSADAGQLETSGIGGTYCDAQHDSPVKQSSTSLLYGTIPNTTSVPAMEPDQQILFGPASTGASQSETCGIDGIGGEARNNTPRNVNSILDGTISKTSSVCTEEPDQRISLADAVQLEASGVGGTFGRSHNYRPRKACSTTFDYGTIPNAITDLANNPHHQISLLELALSDDVQSETSRTGGISDETRYDGPRDANNTTLFDGTFPDTTNGLTKDPDPQILLVLASVDAAQLGTSGICGTSGRSHNDGPKRASSTTHHDCTVPKTTNDLAKERHQQISLDFASVDAAQSEISMICQTHCDAHNDGPRNVSGITLLNVTKSNTTNEDSDEQISFELASANAVQSKTSGIDGAFGQAHNYGTNTELLNGTILNMTNVRSKKPYQHVSSQLTSAGATQSEFNGIVGAFREAHNHGPKNATRTTLRNSTIPNTTIDVAKDPNLQISSGPASADVAQSHTTGFFSSCCDEHNDTQKKATSTTLHDSTFPKTASDLVKKLHKQISLELASADAAQSETSRIVGAYDEAHINGHKKATSNTLLDGAIPVGKETENQISCELASADAEQFETGGIGGTSGDAPKKANSTTSQNDTIPDTTNEFAKECDQHVSLTLDSTDATQSERKQVPERAAISTDDFTTSILDVSTTAKIANSDRSTNQENAESIGTTTNSRTLPKRKPNFRPRKVEKNNKNRNEPTSTCPIQVSIPISNERRFVFSAPKPRNSTSERPKAYPKKVSTEGPTITQEKRFQESFLGMTEEDALREQERLLNAAAYRMRTQARQARIQGTSNNSSDQNRKFSRMIVDVHKSFPDHWQYKDLYSRLGLPAAANDTQIKSQYRKLALVYHPDRNLRMGDTKHKFQSVTEAYSALIRR